MKGNQAEQENLLDYTGKISGVMKVNKIKLSP